jgi:hypothetical protein
MRTLGSVVVFAFIFSGVSFAEMQNVEVGGSLRIRGNYYTSAAGSDNPTARNPLFQGILTNSFRPGSNPLAGLRYAPQPGRLAVYSPFDWDDAGHALKWVEERTRLNVRADFSEKVAAFIELDSYDVWGEDFRSNYLTGSDSRAATADDVEVYQAYIEADELFGYPLRVRVGRQELKFGSGWLVAPNDTAALFYGTSFDGIRATWATELFSVDAFWSKLHESSPLEEDGDVDFSGLYASYLGIENVTLDAYWLWLRDAGRRSDTNGPFGLELVEDLAGVDDYDVTNLHTFGVRAAGTAGALDFDVEAAYQTGEADAVGATFAGAAGPFGDAPSPYGPDDAEWDTWGANATVGYTFDCPWTPRVFANAAYFGGEDNRDVDILSWIGAIECPFWHAKPSVSFNRLFSNWEYTEFFENTDLSNAWLAKVGIGVKPAEKLQVTLMAAHFEALEPYEAMWPTFNALGQRFTLWSPLSFIGKDNSTDIGWEVEGIATYSYTEDLSFEVGWSHLFTGKGLAQGNFIAANGLGYVGGTDDDDADYLYFETKLAF